ncbi:hypothetical protein BK010_02375 [Tenericutes bacterium MO-XQ]|nr:hypothetical protein BK010_02375 [Tenericutes bacterium MO-XQ]
MNKKKKEISVISFIVFISFAYGILTSLDLINTTVLSFIENFFVALIVLLIGLAIYKVLKK